MKHLKYTIAAASIAAFAALAQPLMADELMNYTSLEDDEIVAYLDAAKVAMPDIEFTVLRLSTGDMGARLIADAGNAARSARNGGVHGRRDHTCSA